MQRQEPWLAWGSDTPGGLECARKDISAEGTECEHFCFFKFQTDRSKPLLRPKMVFLEGTAGACKIEIVPGCWAGSTQPTVNQQSTVIGSWWQFDSFNNSLASCRPDRDCLLSHLPASILMHAASPLPSLPDLPCPTMAWKCGVATHCRSHRCHLNDCWKMSPI